MIADSPVASPPQPGSSRWFVLASLLLALGTAYLLHGWVFRVPAMELGWRGEDDSCYYFVIAKNLMAGKGFTFDGVNRTNGFHPLWQGVTALVFGISPNDATALRAVYALQWLMFVLSSVGVAVLARSCVGAAGAWCAMLLFLLLPTVSISMLNGMETMLAVTLVVGAFCWLDRLLRRDGMPTAFDVGVLSLLAAGCMLARLECGLIALVMAFVMWRRWPVNSSRRVAMFFGLSIAPLAAWLIFSQWYFGAMTPVSGMIKRAGAMATASQMIAAGDYLGFLNRVFELRVPSDGLAAVASSQLGVEIYPVVVRLIGCLCLLGPLAIPAVRRRMGAALTAMMVFSVLIVIAGKAIFFGRPLPSYYLVPLFVTYPIAICAMAVEAGRGLGLLVERILAGRIHAASYWLSWAGVACAALSFLGLAARQQRHEQHRILTRQDGYHDSVYAAAKWARKNTSPRETVAAWNAGIIGFYSDRRVVNLDGFVNSVAYAKQLTSTTKDWRALVAGLGVDVVVDRISEGLTPLDRVPDLAGDWREVVRVTGTHPQSLNGGFCAYQKVDLTAGAGAESDFELMH